MSRRPRVAAVDVTHHITQRGNKAKPDSGPTPIGISTSASCAAGAISKSPIG